MSKLVIIGQSPAVVAAAKKIREENSDWQVTVISTDGQLPYDRALLPKLVAKSVKEKDLFCEAEDFYKKNGIETILDKDITRINVQRHKVFMTEKFQVDFDTLIIADSPEPRLPEKKGHKRIGVFHLARLESVRGLIKYLPFTETAVVEAVSLSGIETALALKAAGKVVLITGVGEGFLSNILDPQTAGLLIKLLEKKGLRVLTGHTIEDVLGESEVKAIRLKSGKVMAVDMVVFDGATPDLRFLEGGELVMQERIVTMANMRTNVADVYAIDVVGQMQEPKVVGSYAMATSVGVLQAEVAALAIKGQVASFSLPLEDVRARLNEIFSSDEIKAVEDELVVLSPVSEPVAVASGEAGEPTGAPDVSEGARNE